VLAVNHVAAPPPVNYGVVVFPGFELIDVAGPIAFLNNLAYEEKISLSIIAERLDPVPTNPGPPYNKANSSFSESITPTHTFANPPSDLDFLFVPGGYGTRYPEEKLSPVITYIKSAYPRLKYLMSVCTGATLVARAGVLDGRRATTNKKAWAWATTFGTNVSWVPVSRWVVDGNVWTSSGASAGMDTLLGFLEYAYDKDRAQSFANLLEHEWHSDPSWDPFSAIYNVPGSNISRAEVCLPMCHSNV
jgi:transcriptional regulator GlxA family with amidase domain